MGVDAKKVFNQQKDHIVRYKKNKIIKIPYKYYLFEKYVKNTINNQRRTNINFQVNYYKHLSLTDSHPFLKQPQNKWYKLK